MDINHILLGLRRWQKNLSLTDVRLLRNWSVTFLGSGDNVIPNDTIEKIKENFIREPENKFMGGALWQWKEPVLGHKYIMGIDVSRGDSEDLQLSVLLTLMRENRY